MTDYEYGDRDSEIQHAMRELEQLQLGYTSGALTESEFEAACERVRERYGLRGWPGDE